MKCLSTLILFFITIQLSAQVQTDLRESVPLWFEYNEASETATLQWIPDPNAVDYQISKLSLSPTPSIVFEGSTDGSTNTFVLEDFEKGVIQEYHIRKNNTNGRGLIRTGIEIEAVHQRGRLLLLVEETLKDSLAAEVTTLVNDMRMDGWELETVYHKASDSIQQVKSTILAWYNGDPQVVHSVFLLGHLPVPYSGQTAYDGHANHAGAWPSDAFYADVDGNWTDQTVNNTSASRDANKNIPGDGKFDQSIIPSDLEIEIGRVDFSNLPAFPKSEIELTRKYLVKNHLFRTGQTKTVRRALVENNFASFAEGFGQSGWRSFVPMFGQDSVISTSNYENILPNESYLCSYACGPGSYTSAGGIGNTNNTWVNKEMKTVFTMLFGSYFGDWDTQNNFLRAALASGEVLSNAWAGRPVWHFYPMALGKNIGYCAKLTQNARGSIFETGFGGHATHIALMGDPSLRLHPMKRAENISLIFTEGNIEINWQQSPDADNGYFVYKKTSNSNWETIGEFVSAINFTDFCIDGNATYEYMVRATRLEHSASGSYYNTSQGIVDTITVGENTFRTSYYADTDNDGYGDPDSASITCQLPSGFVENDLDCDDTNPDINPDADEIPNNGIDEDCDGQDLIVSVKSLNNEPISIYPNPVSEVLNIDGKLPDNSQITVYKMNGVRVFSVENESRIDLSAYGGEMLLIEIMDTDSKAKIVEKVVVKK